MQYLSVHRGRVVAALAAGLALAACSDQPTGSGPAAPTQVPFGVMAPVDNSINQADTWVSFDASRDEQTTVTSSEAVYDARSAQYTNTVSAELAPQALHAEAGYDSYGTIRYNEYRQVSTADPTENIVDPTTRIQVVGQQVTTYDEYNQPTYAVNEEDPSVAPLEELGTLSGAQITQTVVLDHEPANGVAIMTSLSATGAGAVTRVRRLSANRISVETSTSETLPSAALAALPGASQGARQDTKVDRTYGRRGDRWVLEELKSTNRTVAGGSTVEHTQRTRLRNVRWHENRGKDEARKKQRDAVTAGGPSRLYQPGDNCTDDPCYPGPGGGDPPPPPPPPPGPCDAGSSGRHMVFQHGIFSNNANWGNMPDRVASDFYVGCKLRPDLDSNDRLASQAYSLAQKITALGRGPLLLVGHSQGGLIGRYAGQHYPNTISGVVTLGTPHRGAPIANTSKIAVAAVLTVPATLAARGCGSTWRGIRCGAVRTLTGMIPSLASWGTDAAVPAFIDLRPGSAFLQGLATTYEPFPRAGLQYLPSRVFVEWRLRGDMFDDGSKYVRTAWVALGVSTACSAVGWIIGFHGAATNCAATAGALLAISLIWNLMTTGLASGDGVVPYSSQVYPGANRNVPIRDNAVSHTGEMRGDVTRKQLRPVLRDVMGVTPRVAF